MLVLQYMDRATTHHARMCMHRMFIDVHMHVYSMCGYITFWWYHYCAIQIVVWQGGGGGGGGGGGARVALHTEYFLVAMHRYGLLAIFR